MGRPATPIQLTEKEEQALRQLLHPTTQYRYVQRARTILLAAEGRSNKEISEMVSLSTVAVSHWRTRFSKHRLDGLKDRPRSGKPARLGHKERLEIINKACSPPGLKTRWTVRELSKSLGFSISKSHLHRIMHELDLKPHQFRMWLFSSDPEFEAKQADIVGLYIDPPKNAFVVCLDEKTGIQATEPLHKKLPMKPGRVERREFGYRRHGTLSLYAAFKVHEGKVFGKTEERHTHVEFLGFVKEVYARWGRRGKDLHFVLDNFSAHKVEAVVEWVEKHPKVHLHFTPTHASWLNQIELWFSILSRQVLSKRRFKSKTDLAEQLLAFIEEYNKTCKPFAWTYKGKPLQIK